MYLNFLISGEDLINEANVPLVDLHTLHVPLVDLQALHVDQLGRSLL